MDKSYYQEYYHIERSHWWFRVREKILLSRLRQYIIQPANILNVGAATGRSSQALSSLGEVVSLEYDPDCVAFVRQQTGLDVLQGSVLDLPFEENRFDVVCAFDVIEHVQDDQQAVREMIRVCKPGGLVMVSVPMYQMLWSAHDEINQHFRRYTLKGLASIFRPHNGQILYKGYFNSLLFPLIALLRIFNKRKSAHTSDFASYKTEGAANKIFYFIFGIEIVLLRFIRFPFGVSGMLVFRKASG